MHKKSVSLSFLPRCFLSLSVAFLFLDFEMKIADNFMNGMYMYEYIWKLLRIPRYQ